MLVYKTKNQLVYKTKNQLVYKTKIPLFLRFSNQRNKGIY